MLRLWRHLIVCYAFVFLSGAHDVLPGSADDSQRQRAQRQLQRLQLDLKHYHQQLRKNSHQEQSVLTALETLSQRQEEIKATLHRLERDLQTTSQRAQKLEHLYSQQTERIRQQQERLISRVRHLYKLGKQPYMTLLVSAQDAADFLYKIHYARRIAQYDRQLLQEYREAIARVGETRALLLTAQQAVLSYQAEAQQTQQRLDVERQRKETLLQRLRHERHLVQQTMAELTEAAHNLTLFLENLSKTSAKDVPSQGLQGQMPWPVNGPVLSSYGKVWHPQLEVYTLQKGVYIGAAVGSDIKAIAPGTVLYADWFKGFGRLLIIDHGGQLVSLYGHTSVIFVEVGEQVHANQIVAKVGDSSSRGQPALYFEIRYRTIPQDPLLWLAHRSARLSK